MQFSFSDYVPVTAEEYRNMNYDVKRLYEQSADMRVFLQNVYELSQTVTPKESFTLAFLAGMKVKQNQIAGALQRARQTQDELGSIGVLGVVSDRGCDGRFIENMPPGDGRDDRNRP